MSTYEQWYRRFLLVSETTADQALAAQELISLAGGIDGSALSSKEKSALRFVCSSLIINAGTDLADVTILQAGQQLASRAQGKPTRQSRCTSNACTTSRTRSSVPAISVCPPRAPGKFGFRRS
ncbi:hypothetical protein BN11_4520005 [Nostocoides australiense Ben110]|uniref:Uncharacterized protein n=1 Tax=Nostocoides australiense Ben110 TaxID=1193182 RepID=W6K476_9MICO|nr:hypothetical protein BN11_4520005 [Tetrasphaera australiensis Ben110]